MTQMVFVSKGRVKLVCPQCQQEFVTFLSVARRPGTHCCSMACEHKLHPRKPRQRVTKTCRVCGKTFEVIKKRSSTANFCSRACVNAYQVGPHAPAYSHGHGHERGKSRAVIAARIAEEGCCEECGATENLHGHHIKEYSKFPDLRNEPSNIQVLCGACHGKRHPHVANALARPRVRSGKWHSCENCAKPFYVKPSHERNGRRFCSVACSRMHAKAAPHEPVTQTCSTCGASFTESFAKALKRRRCVVCRAAKPIWNAA